MSIPRFEQEEGFRGDMMAKFKLCPTGKCGSCSGGGDYVVDMKELIDTYQDYQKELNEEACQSAQETCEYQCQNDDGQNDDGEDCESDCLYKAGMSYCDDEAQEEMNDIGECRAINEQEGEDDNYSSSYQVYYAGAYCTSSGVFAGTFKDSACTKKAPSGTYEKIMGASLPTGAIVPKGCIVDCAPVYDDDANNDGGEINEVCEDLYEQSAKCETHVKAATYKDTSGCELIHDTLPKFNNAFNYISKKQRSASPAAVGWAWFFGILSLVMGGYIFLLHKRVIREKVDLSTLGILA